MLFPSGVRSAIDDRPASRATLTLVDPTQRNELRGSAIAYGDRAGFIE